MSVILKLITVKTLLTMTIYVKTRKISLRCFTGHNLIFFIFVKKLCNRKQSNSDNGMYIQIPVENHNRHNFQPPCDGKKKLFRFTVYVFRCPNTYEKLYQFECFNIYISFI